MYIKIDGWALLEYYPGKLFDISESHVLKKIRERVFENTVEGEEFRNSLKHFLSEDDIKAVYNNFPRWIDIKEEKIKMLRKGKISKKGECIESAEYYVPFTIKVWLDDEPVKVDCIIRI